MKRMIVAVALLAVSGALAAGPATMPSSTTQPASVKTFVGADGLLSAVRQYVPAKGKTWTDAEADGASHALSQTQGQAAVMTFVVKDVVDVAKQPNRSKAWLAEHGTWQIKAEKARLSGATWDVVLTMYADADQTSALAGVRAGSTITMRGDLLRVAIEDWKPWTMVIDIGHAKLIGAK